MSNIWFTGCTHFGHKNIIRLANRHRFNSVEDMDEHLLTVWNQRVKTNDVIYHLGDVTWGNPSKLLPKLNGRIVLIVGNHDDQAGDLHYSLKALPHAHYIEIPHTGPTGMVLCHYPFEDWNGRFRGSIHLHAHTHAKELERPLLPHIAYEDETVKGERGLAPVSNAVGKVTDKWLHDTTGVVCNRFHVGVDSTDEYGPISLDEIVARARGEII